METLSPEHAESAHSETRADLNLEDPTMLSDPDTAGLPDAHDDPHKPRSAQATAGPCALKLLVSNNVAGSLIGKAGSAINDIQGETGARIKLSQSNEFFPATQYRVVLITGTREAVEHASSVVWDKITSDTESILRHPTASSPAGITGRITIPYAAAGLVIGRAGITVRQISDMTGAKIQLSNKEDCAYTQERIVSITGPSDACIRCVQCILDKLYEDPKVGRYTNLTTSYSRTVPPQFGYAPAPQAVFTHPAARQHAIAMMPQPRMAATAAQAVSALGSMARAETLSTMHTIQMAVNDAYMGLVLGRNGSTLTDIQNASGARVVVSARNEYVPGTTNRTVTITGSPGSADMARYMILQRLAQMPGAPISSPPGVGPAMEMNADHAPPRGL